ncbi:MAG: hypothetical protein NVS3B1_12610 [Marmoricola sp.]
MSLFELRLWAAARLFDLAKLVEPEHRWHHCDNQDGTISFWQEPA